MASSETMVAITAEEVEKLIEWKYGFDGKPASY